MPKTRQLFKRYPAYRYKSDCKPRLVYNEADDEALLKAGWEKTPIKDVLAQLPDDLKDNAQVLDKVEEITGNVAAMVNMLGRVDKVRSKKDLRWLAAQLGIELAGDGYSLKELRKMILDEARIHPDFAKHVHAAPEQLQ